MTHGPQIISWRSLAARTAGLSAAGVSPALAPWSPVSGGRLTRGCDNQPRPGFGRAGEGGKFSEQKGKFICSLSQGRVDFDSLHSCDLQGFSQ